MSKRKDATSRKRARIRRLMKQQQADELKLTPGFQSDEALKPAPKMLATDFEPHGMRERNGHSDCSGNFHSARRSQRIRLGSVCELEESTSRTLDVRISGLFTV
jgi:hypothetical protein